MHFDPKNRSARGHCRLRTDWTQARRFASSRNRDGLLRHRRQTAPQQLADDRRAPQRPRTGRRPSAATISTRSSSPRLTINWRRSPPEAAAAGKHVLIEKPGARRAGELDAVADAARRTGALVRIGFNHRYHRAFRKAREIFESGALGEMMFIRGRYGHGGRPGYDREWRADPELSGGGELIDQGAHLIDLSRWFLGDFTSVQRPDRAPTFGTCPWKTTASCCWKRQRGQVAFLHAELDRVEEPLLVRDLPAAWASSRSTGSAAVTAPSG